MSELTESSLPTQNSATNPRSVPKPRKNRQGIGPGWDLDLTSGGAAVRD
jgi:hypothetical protein